MEIQKLHKLFLQSTGISTDTRSTKTNQLFFALKGENFNGNTFAWQAIKKGAGSAIIDEGQYAQNENYIVVRNVLETLQDLARYHRTYLNIPVLAITGSNGKTTSKELIYTVLRKKFETVATIGNLNNHIGVPLTLLSMKPGTEFGIVEMGANQHGEIKNLCEIALPDYGYITNFGKAHLEGFGSIEGVIKAKSELYNHLKSNNKILFLNLDDKVQREHLNYKNTYTFGTTSTADVKVKYPQNIKSAEVVCEGYNFESNITGSYNSVNIASAICIGKYFKISDENISKAIASYFPSNNRSQIVKIGNLTILMDAYNANPTSMRASLESFENYPADTKKILILGDMFELGETSAEEHQKLVSYAENLNFDQIHLIGENFYKVNITSSITSKYESFNQFATEFQNRFPEKAHLLIKGSRGMALERVVELIKDKNK